MDWIGLNFIVLWQSSNYCCAPINACSCVSLAVPVGNFTLKWCRVRAYNQLIFEWFSVVYLSVCLCRFFDNNNSYRSVIATNALFTCNNCVILPLFKRNTNKETQPNVNEIVFDPVQLSDQNSVVTNNKSRKYFIYLALHVNHDHNNKTTRKRSHRKHKWMYQISLNCHLNRYFLWQPTT